MSAQILHNWSHWKQTFLWLSYQTEIHDKIWFKAHLFLHLFYCSLLSAYCVHWPLQSTRNEKWRCAVQCPNSLHESRQTPWRGLNSFCLSLSSQAFSHLFLSRFPTLLSRSCAPPRAATAAAAVVPQEPSPFPLPNFTHHPSWTGQDGCPYRDAVGAIVEAVFLGAFGSCSSLKEQLNLQRYLGV